MDNRRKAILEVAKILIKGIIDGVPVQQQVLEKLAATLGIKSCLIFKIFVKGDNKEKWCELTAGIPPETHGIGLYEPLSKHPDIQKVCEEKEIKIDDNPQNNPLTFHFKELVEKKKIEKIIYLPLISEIDKYGCSEREVIGVIVLDITEGMKFEEREVELCSEVGELMSLIIDEEEALISEMRHEIINPILALGGFINRLIKLTEEFSRDAQIIAAEFKRVESLFPEGTRLFFSDNKKR